MLSGDDAPRLGGLARAERGAGAIAHLRDVPRDMVASELVRLGLRGSTPSRKPQRSQARLLAAGGEAPKTAGGSRRRFRRSELPPPGIGVPRGGGAVAGTSIAAQLPAVPETRRNGKPSGPSSSRAGASCPCAVFWPVLRRGSGRDAVGTSKPTLRQLPRCRCHRRASPAVWRRLEVIPPRRRGPSLAVRRRAD